MVPLACTIYSPHRLMIDSVVFEGLVAGPLRGGYRRCAAPESIVFPGVARAHAAGKGAHFSSCTSINFFSGLARLTVMINMQTDKRTNKLKHRIITHHGHVAEEVCNRGHTFTIFTTLEHSRPKTHFVTKPYHHRRHASVGLRSQAETRIVFPANGSGSYTPLN